MSLRPGWQPPATHLNIISGRGGLGDSLARLPAFKYMIETYEHVSATIYVQDGFIALVEYLLPAGPRLEYKKLSTAPWELKKPYIEFDNNRLTTLHLHLTDHAFLMLMDMLPPPGAAAYPKAKFYVGAGLNYLLKDAGLAKTPFVVFTTDFTAPAREWPACHINGLAEAVREAGLTPVLLGTREYIDTGVDGDPIKPKAASGLREELFVDLRNKTSLVEALGVIQRAKAIVGIDNGLLHLAHYTDVPIVLGFTSLDPQHRVPAREAGATQVIEAAVPCKGCQSRGFAINHDWRTCLFDDYACLLTMTAYRFTKALLNLNVIRT